LAPGSDKGASHDEGNSSARSDARAVAGGDGRQTRYGGWALAELIRLAARLIVEEALEAEAD
jgi:hypothetical protein